MLEHLKQLRRYRDLLITFTLRDIQVRYTQTFLGVAWAIAQPLAFMVILTLVKATVFQEESSEGAPHTIFLYAAMVPWLFFQNSLTFASNSIAGNMNLVKKIYFPREIFPASAILACVLDFLIASMIFLGMMLFYRIPLTVHLVWVPVLFGIELLFVIGIGMFVAASNVFYRDVKYLVPLAIQLLFFASPVFYSVERVPEAFRSWYLLNPMAVVIDGFRKAIVHGVRPEAAPVLMSFAVAGVCCALAYKYFKHFEARFADFI